MPTHPFTIEDYGAAKPLLLFETLEAQLLSDPKNPGLPVFGLDVVGESLGLLVSVVIVVAVAIVGGTDVLHLVNAAALGATFDRAFAGHLERIVSKYTILGSRVICD